MHELSSLTPTHVWKHFLALSAIPRLSGNESAAADYVQQVAAGLGLPSRRDAAGNVLITQPASPGRENHPGVILQAHLDMVGQKTPDSTHDFARDPLRLRLDGGWVRATGTTLGADNGIGVALALGALEDRSFARGPLAALFTVDEEVGLRGAAEVGADFLPGAMLINIDGDREDELIVGCAGSANVRGTVSVNRIQPDATAAGLRVRLAGLLGGHSGADIHRGRGNAHRLLARVLAGAVEEGDLRLATWRGGDARNAIPRSAEALVVAEAARIGDLRDGLAAAAETIRRELAQADPGLTIAFEVVAPPPTALDAASTRRVIDLLRAVPIGVLRFSDTHAGVVETSNNLAIVTLGAEEGLEYLCLTRSLVESAKLDAAETIGGLARLAGGTAEISGSYPGWQPAQESALVRLVSAANAKVRGQPPSVVVVHGGLECGLLRAKQPALECVSIGARIDAMHSPDEKLEVASVGTTYAILCEALQSVGGIA